MQLVFPIRHLLIQQFSLDLVGSHRISPCLDDTKNERIDV